MEHRNFIANEWVAAAATRSVIDPATGESATESLVQVTVAGSRTWECEVWATGILVRPALLTELPAGMSCVAFSLDGTRRDDFAAKSNEKVA